MIKTMNIKQNIVFIRNPVTTHFLNQGAPVNNVVAEQKQSDIPGDFTAFTAQCDRTLLKIQIANMRVNQLVETNSRQPQRFQHSKPESEWDKPHMPESEPDQGGGIFSCC